MKDKFLINNEPLSDTRDGDMAEAQSGTPLLKENLLSEFSDPEKNLVRNNLNVYAKDVLMTSEEITEYVVEKIAESIAEHLKGDKHDIQTKIDNSLEGYVKSDGSVPFTGRVKGVTPVEDDDLSTKKYADDNIILHKKESDPHGTLAEVRNILKSYVLSDDALTLSTGYTREQIDSLIKDFMDINGTRGFAKPVTGKYPIVSAHLSTKEYVDDVMSNHNCQSDPHGFKYYVIQTLTDFARIEDVYRKDETYSRSQINAKIEEIAGPVVESMMREHLIADDPHHTLETVRQMDYMKRDGSTGFTATVKGVPGVASKDLIVKEQLDKVEKKFDDLLKDDSVNSNRWTPSGPVQATVGLVNRGTMFNDPMSLQQIIDAFFYGKSLSLECPEYCKMGESVDLTMTVRPTSMIDDVKLYQDEMLIGQYSAADFGDSGCKTVKSMPVNKCTTFKMVVTFTNGTKCEDYASCCVAHTVYVGAMPKWLQGSATSIEYLEQLCNADPINNKRFNYGKEVCEYENDYIFNNPAEPKSLFIAMPIDYPSLQYMTTVTQQFPANQFVSIDNIPYTLADGSIIMYKIFIFPQGIVEMNMKVVYKLNCGN